MTLKKSYKSDFTTINKIYNGKMERKNGFNGVIQGAYIDKVGNFIVLYEKKYSFNSSTPSANLGDVALLTITPDGNLINTAVFPCNIFKIGFADPLSYNNLRKGIKEQGECNGLANAQNFSLDFIATDNKEYVFFNNTFENMNKSDNEEAKLIKTISSSTAVMYTLKNGEMKKEYLFGEPKDKKDNEFCNFGCSDYNKETKTYATLVTDPKTKKTAVLWMKLD